MSPYYFLGELENRVQKKIFAPNKERVRGGGKNYIMRNLTLQRGDLNSAAVSLRH
jgi:hypothetical protein